MRLIFKLFTAVLLLIIATACAGNTTPAADKIQGPALVVFYTDN